MKNTLYAILGHVAIFVADIAKSKDFYSRIFEMREIWSDHSTKTYLTTNGLDILGLLKTDPKQPFPKPAVSLSDIENAEGGTPNFFHFGWNYNVKSAFDDTLGRIDAIGIERTRVRWSRDGTASVYFSDLDGNLVQLTLLSEQYGANENA